ncbi:protein FAR1-RELATED SEQUENCE 5-like [Silene latifolia]|uniref:protein FAR1-RELATED SEQUENCE 5-like n=1 Tax=Silene latifolia TaxID=37657 RepID=UPI003D789EF4
MVIVSTNCSSTSYVCTQEHASITETVNDEDDSQMVDAIVGDTNDMDISTNPEEDILLLTNCPDQLLVNDVPDSPEVVASSEIHGVPHCSEELKPFVGMKFENLEQGLDFYKACGFSPRLDSSKIIQGVTTHKSCVCNKEGNRQHGGQKRRRAITRVGCPAKIKFKRLPAGEYEVYEFIELHSHAMVTPATMIHLKSFRKLNLVHKKMIMDNSRVNQGPVKTFRMFKEYVRGYKNVGASLEDFKNFSRDVKKYIKEYDAEMLIEGFMQKRARCPSFYLLMLMTTKDSLRFSGLIQLQLRTMHSLAMGGCYPTTLITDQCLGIKAGVKNVFSGNTTHRFCMWHIMKKLPDKVGSTIYKDTDFLKEISYIVWNEDIEPTEFESSWCSIMEKHDLSGNEWLKSMFEDRKLWIPAYFRDTYMGGLLRTTSRSESENSFFGNFTNPNLSLVQFWIRFQSAMDAQRWKHSKLTADSKNSSPILSTPLSIEKKCAEFYTPPVFYDFQEELKGACYSCIEANKSTKERDVERLFVMDRESKKVYEVDVDGKTLVCSCKRFQRFGILCRHCVWVFHNKGFDEIPSEYLLPRWSNYATFRPIFKVVGTSLEADCASIDTRQNTISELWSGVFTAVSLVEDDEEKEKELLELLQSFNEKLLISSSGGKSKSKKTQIETFLGSKIPTKAHILPPNQAKIRDPVEG